MNAACVQHENIVKRSSESRDLLEKEIVPPWAVSPGRSKPNLPAVRHISISFTPLGVIQGWSPGSMAEAARKLVAMGDSYLALGGGTVPLKVAQIKACLSAIRDVVPRETCLRILGFAKASEIESFAPLGITSYDTTSPLIRAFKDAKANYSLPADDGRLASSGCQRACSSKGGILRSWCPR